MVSNTTIDTINLITDINIEYNIKISIMVVMWLYFAAVFWLSFKLDGDRFFIRAWRLLSRVIPVPYLVFAPLFAMFLLRSVSFETVYLYMFSFYTIFLTIWFVLFILAISEFGLYILGIKMTPKRIFKQLGNKTPFSESFTKK